LVVVDIGLGTGFKLVFFLSQLKFSFVPSCLETFYCATKKRIKKEKTEIMQIVAAERAQAREEIVGMAIELASARSDKELIHALHRRLTSEEDQHLILTNTIKDVSDKDVSFGMQYQVYIQVGHHG
jgi:uncharacterized protein YPO0396